MADKMHFVPTYYKQELYYWLQSVYQMEKRAMVMPLSWTSSWWGVKYKGL